MLPNRRQVIRITGLTGMCLGRNLWYHHHLREAAEAATATNQAPELTVQMHHALALVQDRVRTQGGQVQAQADPLDHHRKSASPHAKYAVPSRLLFAPRSVVPVPAVRRRRGSLVS